MMKAVIGFKDKEDKIFCYMGITESGEIRVNILPVWGSFTAKNTKSLGDLTDFYGALACKPKMAFSLVHIGVDYTCDPDGKYCISMEEVVTDNICVLRVMKDNVIIFSKIVSAVERCDGKVYFI